MIDPTKIKVSDEEFERAMVVVARGYVQNIVENGDFEEPPTAQDVQDCMDNGEYHSARQEQFYEAFQKVLGTWKPIPGWDSFEEAVKKEAENDR